MFSRIKLIAGSDGVYLIVEEEGGFYCEKI